MKIQMPKSNSHHQKVNIELIRVKATQVAVCTNMEKIILFAQVLSNPCMLLNPKVETHTCFVRPWQTLVAS